MTVEAKYKVFGVEITETMIRKLYNKHKHKPFMRIKITDMIDNYIYKHTDDDEFEFGDDSVEAWVNDIIDNIMEEEYTADGMI